MIYLSNVELIMSHENTPLTFGMMFMGKLWPKFSHNNTGWRLCWLVFGMKIGAFRRSSILWFHRIVMCVVTLCIYLKYKLYLDTVELDPVPDGHNLTNGILFGGTVISLHPQKANVWSWVCQNVYWWYWCPEGQFFHYWENLHGKI